MSFDLSFFVAWIYQIEGTSVGSRTALWLAILAAFLHAVFGALQKGRHDPWLSRGAMDASSGLAMLPLAIFIVPIPEPELWPIFLIIFIIHFMYKLLQAFAYSKGSFTVEFFLAEKLTSKVKIPLFLGFVLPTHFQKQVGWGT